MKVLHILASSIGGGASHVYDLIVHGEKKIEQILIISPDGGTITHRLRKIGVKVYEIDIIKGWHWKSVFQIIQIIRVNRPSIVHCHGFRAGFYGRIAAKLACSNVKTVLTVHGFHCFYFPNYWKKNAFIWLERLMRPLTDHVIAVSNSDWRNLLKCKIASKRKSGVILNGISAEYSLIDRNEIKIRINLGSEYPIIGTVARLHSQKGIRYFLQAVPSILYDFPNAIVLIVGDGPEKKQLLQLAADLNISNHVRFLGNRDDAVDILQIMNVFVLASLWEGLPLSILEAMRANIPVVATDVDGSRDVIEDKISGFMVPPKNSEEISKAVISLLKNQVLASNLVDNAQKRLKSEFSFQVMLQKTRLVYADLI